MRASHDPASPAAGGAASAAEDPAAVLLCYGQLAAELEEGPSPARRDVLQHHLAALDAWLEHAADHVGWGRAEARGTAGE